MLDQRQVSNFLDGFNGFWTFDDNFLAIFADPAAAIGQSPHFRLPGPVVDNIAILDDIVGINAFLFGSLAVSIYRELLCKSYEFIPGHRFGGRGIFQSGSIKHILVVVQQENFVRAGIGNRSTVFLECNAVQRHGFLAFIHSGDISKQTLFCEVKDTGFTHDTAVRQFTGSSHGVQFRDIFLIRDRHNLDFDIGMFCIELVGDGLDTCRFIGGTPIRVSDCHGVSENGGRRAGDDENAEEKSK